MENLKTNITHTSTATNQVATAKPEGDDALLFEELKAVLLKEDREALQRLQDILDQPALLAPKMSPVLEQRLATFKQAFPHDYRILIDQIISEKLLNSKEELLEAIYPIMGKLIKKYIALQFALLRESIDRKTKFGFWNRVKSKTRSTITGVSGGEAILNDLDKGHIDNIFIIQKHSGLLIASLDTNPKKHHDIIAGMMTAIKAFAEEAFDREATELEEINYGDYLLLLESYFSYYFVVAIKGSISSHQNALIHEKMNNFASDNLSRDKVKDGQFSLAISIKLQDYFINNKHK